MKIQKTIASAALALSLAAALVVFYCAEDIAPIVQEGYTSGQKEAAGTLAYHALDRLENTPTPAVISNCLECHTISPHVSDKRTRAFLNLHSRALDCTICHLGGKLVYGELPKPGIEPEELLVTVLGAGGNMPPPVEVEEATGKHLAAPPARFNPKGPSCKRCHRRGSTILRALGRYEGYRRRILEDLEILSLVKVRK